MATILDASCPKCRQALRIPADWVGRTVRCKGCGQTLETRPRTAAAPAAPVGDSFSLDPSPDADPFAVSPMVTRRAGYHRGRRVPTGLVAVGVVLLLVGGMVAAGVLLAPHLAGKTGFGTAKPTDPEPRTPPATTEPGKAPFLPTAAGPYPRRVLAVSVSNYLYANPTNYGAESSTVRSPFKRDVHSLLNAFATNWFVPKQQLFELADNAPGTQARPPLKAVIEQTVEQFLATSRPQDRVVLLFVGHAVALDKEAFLVPLEGDLKDAKTLIPLKWLYGKLAACKAQQKLFIADVCRYDPTRGLERPGSGPMAPELEAALKAPPAGVQVLSACSAGQYSHEYDYLSHSEVGEIKGGVFLNTLFPALASILKEMRKPESPLPVKELAARVTRVTELAQAQQTPFLAGAPDANGVPYDAKEELARAFEIPQPSVAGGGAASKELVRAIFREVEVPSLRVGREGTTAASLDEVMPFPAELLAKYADDMTPDQIREQKDKYPLRAAVLEAVELLRGIRAAQGAASGDLPDELKQEPDDKFNERLRRNQRKLGEVELNLQEIEERLVKAGEGAKEQSPRWKAHYDFVLAQVMLRRAYWLEYNLMFGKVRKRELPPLPDGGKGWGWRLASTEKLTGTGDAKERLTEARKLLAKLAREHKGTPWEILARREQFTAVGLQWVPTRFAE